MPTLADIYSAADSFKRRLTDAAMNPGASLQQMLGYANDRARAQNERLAQSAAESQRTGEFLTPTDRQMAMDLAQSYNPAGMVKPYGMSHRPMTVEQGAAPLHDLMKAFDDTIYGPSGVQNYGTGSPRLDREALRVFNQVRNKPDATVTIYRAVPQNASGKINPGDWVTVSKEYAMEHGEGPLGGKYKIISQKVPAKHVTTNADSILEQGYYPE